MNVALWDQLDFYSKKLDIERNKAVRNRFQFVGNSCEKDSWAILLCHQDNVSNDTSSAVLSEAPVTENDDERAAEEVEAEAVRSEFDEEDQTMMSYSEYDERGASKRKQILQEQRRTAPVQRGSTSSNPGNSISGRVACPTCGKMFKTMGELKQHEPFHTRVRSFVCAVCQKSFLYASSYYAHKRRHMQAQSRVSRSLSTSPEANIATTRRLNETVSSHSTKRGPRGFEELSSQ